MSLVAVAPGKVFLSGEYAVLEGAPAIVAAVNRWAMARPAVAASSAPEVRLAAARMAQFLGLADGAPPEVDVSTLSLGETKLGLGSSAAAAVAAAGAIALRAGKTDLDSELRRTILEAATRGHAEAQGGGSGADVAASVVGGVVRVVRGAAPARAKIGAPLHLVIAWTGTSARTSELVARALQAGLPPLVHEAAAAMDAALAAGDAKALFEAVLLHRRALQEIADMTGAPMWPQGLRRFMQRSIEMGIPAKPSGAGGGDLGVAFAPDPEAADALSAALAADGLMPLPLEIVERGVAFEGEAGDTRRPS